jgi:hypothetical protein
LPQKINPLVFENISAEGKIKVMFPDGAKVIPLYGIGVPLGVEKPLLEPRLKEEQKNGKGE